MSPFKPKGDRSLRAIVASLTASASPGDLLAYKDLAIALDLPENDRTQIRQAVSAARPVILRDHNRALIPVRGEGYRIAYANEFAGLAQDHRRKADRQMTKALDIVSNVNEQELSPQELQRHRAVAMVIKNLHNRMTGAESRLEQLEKAVFGERPPTIQGRVENLS
jgi:hypothetical protein